MAHFFESSNETIIQKNERKKKMEKKDTFSEAIDQFKNELENIKIANHKKFNKKLEQFLKNFKNMKNLSDEQIEYFNEFLHGINISILNKSNEKKVKAIIAIEEDKILSDEPILNEKIEKTEMKIKKPEETNFNVELVRILKIENIDERTNALQNILQNVKGREQISENIINKIPFKISNFDFFINFTEKFNFEQAFLNCHYLNGNYIFTNNREYQLYYKIFQENYEDAKAYYIEHMTENTLEKLLPFKYAFFYQLVIRAVKNNDYAFALDLILLIKKFYFDCIEKSVFVNKIFKNFFYAIDLLLIINSENILHKKQFNEFFDRFLIFSENNLNIKTENIQMKIYAAFYQKEQGNNYAYEILERLI